MLKKSLIFKRPVESIKKELLALNGHNFGAFFTKEFDAALKLVFKELKLEFFKEFAPSDDEIPLCALGLSNYALCEIGYACKAEILLCYKDLRGYDAKGLASAFKERLLGLSSSFCVRILDIDEIENALKNNLELKSEFACMRYICASKRLYKDAKEIITNAKNKDLQSFIKYHIDALAPYDDVLLLSQKPNLKSGYGGFFEYERTMILLGLDATAKENALKYISDKEFSEFVLSSEFLSSFMSALRLCGGNDSIESSFLESTARILNIKTKRELDERILLVAKALTAMQRIAVYSRYLIKAHFSRFFAGNFSFSTLRNSRILRHFYLLENTIFTPLHAKPKSLLEALKNINSLPDEPFKFHIESIIYLKRIPASKCANAELCAFKKIFYRTNSFWILKALLDGEQLFTLIKPMEHTRHLAQFGDYKFSVDEYSLMCVYHLENIADNGVLALYNELSAENKALLKLVALMHEVAKSQGNATHGAQGANIFRSYASKLEISANSTALGVTLIKNHSLMNQALKNAAKNTPKVVLNIISHVGSIQALKMLYILTYSIVNATNEGFYNNSKQLKELYEKALDGFKSASDDSFSEGKARAKKENLIKKQSEFLSLENESKTRILGIISNLFFIKYKASEIIKIALWAMKCANISVDISSGNGLCVEMIVKRGWNMIMVLSELSKLDLEYMEVFELFENKFFVKLKYAKSVAQSEFDGLEARIIAALCDKGEAKVQKARILASEISSIKGQDYAKININAKDSRGFMAYILSAFSKFNLRLANARIQTIKNRTRNLYLIELDKDFECNFENFKNYITKE